MPMDEAKWGGYSSRAITPLYDADGTSHSPLPSLPSLILSLLRSSTFAPGHDIMHMIKTKKRSWGLFVSFCQALGRGQRVQIGC